MKKLLLGLAVLAACHKASDERLQTADALWALAPADVQVGVVVTPRGVQMIEHAWQDVRTFMRTAPELAPYAAKLDAMLQQGTGSATISLADAGLTPDKGAAMFYLPGGRMIMVFPVADRDKFLAKVHGHKGSDGTDSVDGAVCKQIKGVYACGDTADLLASLGSRKSAPHFDARGDIELVAANIPGTPIGSVTVAAQLARGAMTVRASVAGVPAAFTAKLGAPLKPELDRDHSAGFAVFNLGALLSALPEVPIGAGVTTATFASSVAGPMYLSVPAGTQTADLRIPLKDPAPAQTLIDRCTDFLPPSLGATSRDGACHLPASALGVPIDAWIENKTFRIGMQQPPAPASVPLGRAGSEIADGAWTFAFWGRGTALLSPSMPVPLVNLQDPTVQVVLRAMMMVNEMGFAARVDGDKLTAVVTVRTAFANPDDVVAKLATVSPADILAGKGRDLAASIATGSSPLADDVKAGAVGLLPPLTFGVFVTSFLSAVGPPDDEYEPPPTEPTTP